jgi:exopolysaccharide biosynthesis polyprenyl glycosylphosphotransferase
MFSSGNDGIYAVGGGAAVLASSAQSRRLTRATQPALAGASVLKRLEDVCLSALLLLVLLPFMALIVVWIRLDSPRSALFRQRRIGFSGQEFQVLKFRTMHAHCAESTTCGRQTTRDDPRVTRAGAWLRRYSVDELPQLINVLRGEMSLVGPRPHAPGTCAGGRPFEQVVASYPARHRVRPGITGLAQIRGWRGETETEEKLLRRVQSDLEYIENWSLWLDLKILAQTPQALAMARNAY